MAISLNDLKLFIQGTSKNVCIFSVKICYFLGLEDNNTSFYVLSSLLAIILEEISTFKMNQFCFATNGFQFQTMKELVLKSMEILDNEDADWAFLLDGTY